MRRVMLGLALLLLNGCAYGFALRGRPSSVDDAYDKTKVNVDSHTGTSSVTLTWKACPDFGAQLVYLCIKEGACAYAMNLSVTEIDWIFANEVYALGGKKLSCSTSDRNVNRYGSTVSEYLNCKASESQFREWSRTGVSLGVRGDRGSKDCEIPAMNFAGFLRKVDEVKKAQ